MNNNKTIKIELSGESPVSPDYFYAELELPASAYEIEDAMQRARLFGTTPGSANISVEECRILPALTNMRLDSTTVSELNYFAVRLAELNDDEINVFQAVAPRIIGDDELVSVKDLINMTYGFDEVSVISGVRTDEQLGQFVIENDLNEDIADIPESSLYLLNKAQIGKLQRENDGGIFVGNTYVVAGEYSLPEVYDGEHIPKEDENPFVFRLYISKASEGDSGEIIHLAQWINLPIEKPEAEKIAHSLDATHIEDCVYYGLESVIPQITEETFGNMQDFDELNNLAQHYTLLSQSEQVKFKAALEAEKPLNISAANDIADHLYQYSFDSRTEQSSEFFKLYLSGHLDTKFDTEWLDTLLTRNEGDRLLARLGATITDYGVISARGHSLNELVPYDEPEVKAQSVSDDKLEIIEIIDRVALFTDERLSDDDIPEGLYRYDLRQSDDGDTFATIEPYVRVNHGGTILTKEPLEFGDSGFIALDEDSSPNFNGEMMTPEEFANTDFTEEQDGGLKFE